MSAFQTNSAEGKTARSAAELGRIDLEHLWHPFTQQKVWSELGDPLVIERGDGMELVDVDGNRYLDGVSSLWCNVHGHGVPELLAALHDQVDRLCHSTLLGLSHAPVLELTDALIKIAPQNLSRVFFSDSGAAAVEAAIRMSVEWWQKQGTPAGKKKTKFLSLSSAYHGDTLGAVTLGYIEEFHHYIKPLLAAAFQAHAPHVYRFYEGLSAEAACEQSLNDLSQVLKREGQSIAACVIEPIVQAAAGIWVHTPEFLAEVARLCREHDVFLIVDEVATGFGKTGKMFAVEHAAAVSAVEPDFLVLGKGLSAGYLPISAVMATEHVFKGFFGEPSERKAFFSGQTFAGNPLAARVACANLELFRSHDLLSSVNRRIPHFQKELDAKVAGLPQVDEVRYFGLMVGIELTKTPGRRAAFPPDERAGIRIVMEARKRGVIIRPIGNVVVLMPALAMDEKDLSRLVEVTAEAISTLR